MTKSKILSDIKRDFLILGALLVFVFAMTGCDPAIGYEYYLNNQSDSILIVRFKGEGFSSRNSDSIKKVIPQTEILIYETEIWGKNPHDEKDNFLRMFDTITITMNNGVPIKKDIQKRENWKYDNDISHIGFIKTGTNIYRLDLTNDDLLKNNAR